MKKNLLFLITIFLFGCHGNSLNDKVKVNDLKQFFSTSLRDSSIVIDSFKLVNVDTLSAQNGYIFMSNKLSDIIDLNDVRAKKLEADIQYNLSNYKLMMNNPYAGSLLSMYKDDYNKSMNELKELIHNDSLYLVVYNKGLMFLRITT